ncbi:MAG: hypothetical protein V3U60_16040 [Gammaproteobacteria bacterium]
MPGFEFEWFEDEDDVSAFAAEFGEWLCRVFPDCSQADSTSWKYTLRRTYYESPLFDATARFEWFDEQGFADADAAKSAAQEFANAKSYQPPEHIWMQVRDDEGNPTAGTEDHTWTEESIRDTDVEYVRADVPSGIMSRKKDSLATLDGQIRKAKSLLYRLTESLDLAHARLDLARKGDDK